MKQVVIFRKRFEFIDYPEVYRQYRVFHYSFPVFLCSASVLVTDSDNLFMLKEDIQQTLHINPLCRILVVSPVSQHALLKALFPRIEVVRNDVPLVFSSIITRFSEGSQKKTDFILSKREEEYLSHVRTGMKDEAICVLMNVSLRTLKRTKEQLLKKTGLNSSLQLAMFSVLYMQTNDNDSVPKTNEKAL